jgi:hypothetical protein
VQFEENVQNKHRNPYAVWFVMNRYGKNPTLNIVNYFTYPNIDWNAITAIDAVTVRTLDCDQFIESIKDSFSHQHVDQPMRYRGAH